VGYENCINCGFICTILQCPLPGAVVGVQNGLCGKVFVFTLYIGEGEVEQEVVGNCGGEMNVLIL
jgi:hypothetical protein